MARYIDADKIDYTVTVVGEAENAGYRAVAFESDIDEIPTADVVEVETVKAWLYEMAINNVGCAINGDFSNACEEIIAKLDGLRNFAKERSDG